MLLFTVVAGAIADDHTVCNGLTSSIIIENSGQETGALAILTSSHLRESMQAIFSKRIHRAVAGSSDRCRRPVFAIIIPALDVMAKKGLRTKNLVN